MLDHEVAFLFELRGETPGTARGLTGQVFRIGCDMENDLVLQDVGIALYQAEIRQEDEQFVIRNLSREGAVFLNGEPFEQAVLRKGDILTLGDSMFRFVSRGESLSQEELWRPVGGRKSQIKSGFTRSKRFWLTVLLCLVAAGAVLWITTRRGAEDKPPGVREMQGEPHAPSLMDPRTLSVLYDRGADLMSARRWDQALVVLERVRNESPNYKDVDRLYQQGLLESLAAHRLNQAKGYTTEGALALAREELVQIGDASVLYREAERLIRDIDRQRVEVRLDKVRAFMAAGDWLSARGEAVAMLEDDPKNEDAADLLRQIDRLEGTPRGSWRFTRRKIDAEPSPRDAVPVGMDAQGGERTAVGSEAAGGASAGSGVSAAAAKPRNREAVLPPSPWQQAVAAYLKGDTDRSLAELRRLLERNVGGDTARKARGMQSDILDAKSWFHQAETLQKEGRTGEALEMWERFLEKDREVAGKAESAYFRQASAHLSRIYYGRGKEAFDAGEVVAAARFWRMGSRMDPTNEDLKEGNRQLGEAAQKYYREGYSLQAINPRGAVEKWNMVLEIVPPGDPYHQKAKSKIDRSLAVP